MTRWHTIPWVFGICLSAVTLIGANRLLNPDDASSGGAKAKPAAAAPAPAGGTVVLGTVDCDPGKIDVGPPAILGASTVDKVLVVEGQEVKVGDPLAQFDDRIFQAKLKQANAELLAAREDVNKADAQSRAHVILLDGQQKAINAADQDLKDATDALANATDQFERVLAVDRNLTTSQLLTAAEKEQRRQDNTDLRKIRILQNQARAKVDGERVKLEALKLTPVEVDVRMAAAKVARLLATVEEAQAAVDACLIKARTAGVVEQVGATPGMTFGPGTRVPVAVIIPSGPRVVRAEVEAEFASKVAGKEGRKVTIFDASNFALTYEGVVKRVGTAYLPKRSTADALAVAPSKALECLIEIPDPAPAGKPPLRVGQPVRVSFP